METSEGFDHCLPNDLMIVGSYPPFLTRYIWKGKKALKKRGGFLARILGRDKNSAGEDNPKKK